MPHTYFQATSAFKLVDGNFVDDEDGFRVFDRSNKHVCQYTQQDIYIYIYKEGERERKQWI